MRKNLFVQHSRFINSCNREGSTFEVAVNFLGDRLDAELDVLLGTTFSDADEPKDGNDSTSSSAKETSDLEQKLPREFDWRPRGAVTPVRCKCCFSLPMRRVMYLSRQVCSSLALLRSLVSSWVILQ